MNSFLKKSISHSVFVLMTLLSSFQLARVAIVLMIGIAVVALPVQAQPPCPAGSVTHTIVRQMMYNGVCCAVTITYCVGMGGGAMQIVLRDAAIVDETCWGLPAGSPPPFSESFLVNYLRDLVIRDANPGGIPTCPTMLNVSIDFSTATCAEWKTRGVDPDGEGPLPAYLEWYLSWCSEVACVRVCQVCVNPSDLDPCTSEPRLYFQCAPYFNPGCPGVPIPTNCTNLCGS